MPIHPNGGYVSRQDAQARFTFNNNVANAILRKCEEGGIPKSRAAEIARMYSDEAALMAELLERP